MNLIIDWMVVSDRVKRDDFSMIKLARVSRENFGKFLRDIGYSRIVTNNEIL